MVQHLCHGTRYLSLHCTLWSGPALSWYKVSLFTLLVIEWSSTSVMVQGISLYIAHYGVVQHLCHGTRYLSLHCTLSSGQELSWYKVSFFTLYVMSGSAPLPWYKVSLFTFARYRVVQHLCYGTTYLSLYCTLSSGSALSWYKVSLFTLHIIEWFSISVMVQGISLYIVHYGVVQHLCHGTRYLSLHPFLLSCSLLMMNIATFFFLIQASVLFLASNTCCTKTF